MSKFNEEFIWILTQFFVVVRFVSFSL